MTPFDLSGQHVVVVGGSSGIGFAVARLALDLGARVTLASRTRAKLEAAAKGLQAKPAILAFDAIDPGAAAEAFATLDPIDHLVTTAGGAVAQGPLAETGWEGMSRTMVGKLGAQIEAVRAALPRIADRASVTLTSGAASRAPSKGSGALTATNAAIEALVGVLALELAPRRVNAVSPGLVDTAGLEAMAGDGAEALLARTAEALPVGIVAKPDDLAPHYVALMCGRYATGAVIDVNGGALL